MVNFTTEGTEFYTESTEIRLCALCFSLCARWLKKEILACARMTTCFVHGGTENTEYFKNCSVRSVVFFVGSVVKKRFWPAPE